MAAKIFFKHLFTSIGRRKAQPFLLVVVIAVAVLVCISTVNIKTFTEENNNYTNRLTYGNSDFIVNVNTLSDNYFFIDEGKENFGEKTEVLGTFPLPVCLEEGEGTFFGVACNLADADKIFDLALTNNVEIESAKIFECVLISKSFAEKNNLKVGDYVAFDIMKTPFRYKIYGITKDKFLNQYDIIIDASSVMDYFLSSSGSIYFNGAEYDLATQLYFSVKAGYDKAEVYSSLHAFYSDMTIQRTSDLRGSTDGLSRIVIIMIALTVFFVICVIYCCCNILATQRMEETTMFGYVGAKKYMLDLVSMCELALYFLLGAGVGTALSYPLGQFTIEVCRFPFCQNKFHLDAMSISYVSIFVATEGSYLFFILAEKMRTLRRFHPKKSGKNNVFLSVLTAVFCTATLVMTVFLVKVELEKKWVLGLSTYFVFACSIVLFTKCVCTTFPTFFLKKAKKNPAKYYALKNITKTETLSNVSALFCLLLTVIFAILILLTAYKKGVDTYTEILSGDYIVLSAPTESIETIKESNQDVSSVECFLKENLPFPYDDNTFDIYGATDISVFSDSMKLSRLPEGNEAFVFGMFAEWYGMDVGDEFTFMLGKREITVVIAGLVKINTNGMVIDAEYWGIPYNYTIVTGQDGVDKEVLYHSLSDTLSSNSALVLGKDTVNEIFLQSNGYGYYCGWFMFYAVLFFSLIGITDTVVSSYRSRKEEFYSYGVAGMNKKNMRKMVYYEMRFVILCGFILFVLFSALSVLILFETGDGQSIRLLWAFV